MGLLLPFALGLLALAIPIIVLYLLKVKREDVTISSNMLWRKVLEDRQANAPWQKLQKNWLLLLQLLLLLLLVLWLARPFVNSEAQVTGNLIVLLDASAAMQATDVAPNRFAKGKDEVKKLIDNMGSGDQMTLVLMRAFPDVVASNSANKSELRAALERAKVSSEPAKPKPSIVLASAAADRTPGTTVIVVSGGNFAREEGLPSLRAKVQYVKVGESAVNQAISALRLRETGGGPQLFIGLNNYGDEVAKINLSITVDDKPFDTREIEIGPEDKASVTLTDLPIATRVVNAKIKPSGDAQDYLATDNEAWTVRTASNPQKLLLVTPGNTFLELFLTRLPNYKVSKISPSSYENMLNRDSFDLYIFDTFAPDKPPIGGLFFISPPTSPFLPVSGTVNTPTFARLEQTDPLLRYTDLGSVAIRQAKQYTLPGWLKTIASNSEGVPLLASGDNESQRVVLLTFDIHDSDIGLTTAWPIFLINMLSWLQPAGALEQVTEVNPGEPVSFVATNPNEELNVQSPANATALVPIKASNGVASFTDTGLTGIYALQRKQTVAGKVTTLEENFVVNLYNSFASNIRPLDDLGLQGTIAPEKTVDTRSDHEIWQPIAFVVLALLMLEWWISNRLNRRVTKKPTLATKGRNS